MGTVTNRTTETSRGCLTISPWSFEVYTYALSMINLGNNSITNLEVVSALNSLNLGVWEYHLNVGNCYTKYNPKVYLGAFQSVALGWNTDCQNGTKWDSNGYDKSGS